MSTAFVPRIGIAEPGAMARWNMEIKDLLRPLMHADRIPDAELVLVCQTLALRCKLLEGHGGPRFCHERFAEVQSADQLNDLLVLLYDWADAERVWMGA